MGYQDMSFKLIEHVNKADGHQAKTTEQRVQGLSLFEKFGLWIIMIFQKLCCQFVAEVLKSPEHNHKSTAAK